MFRIFTLYCTFVRIQKFHLVGTILKIFGDYILEEGRRGINTDLTRLFVVLQEYNIYGGSLEGGRGINTDLARLFVVLQEYNIYGGSLEGRRGINTDLARLFVVLQEYNIYGGSLEQWKCISPLHSWQHRILRVFRFLVNVAGRLHILHAVFDPRVLLRIEVSLLLMIGRGASSIFWFLLRSFGSSPSIPAWSSVSGSSCLFAVSLNLRKTHHFDCRK